MGPRRDEITGMDRAQIAINVLSPYRLRGFVSELVQAYLHGQALLSLHG